MKEESYFSLDAELHAKDIAQQKFYDRQNEKNYFLGEYKERVMVGLTKRQLMGDELYQEVIDIIIKRDKTYLLKMNREVTLAKLHPYIDAAERSGLRYELVDGLSYAGEVGLVVVAHEALEIQVENPILPDVNQDYFNSELDDSAAYIKNKGKHICHNCYDTLVEELPNHKNDFKKFDIKDRFLGRMCPICKK